jgi:hypothetical protein
MGVTGSAASENPALAIGLQASIAVGYPTRGLMDVAMQSGIVIKCVATPCHRCAKKPQHTGATTSLRH